MKDYFVLFACCIPVNGHSRSTICDLQRNTFELIPNVLYEILTEHKDKSIKEIFAVYDNEYNEVIEEYFQFLANKNLGFYTNEPKKFPQIDLTWHEPNIVTNALLDFDEQSSHDLSIIVQQLTDLYCSGVELRFFYPLSMQALRDVLDTFDDTTIRSIKITAGYHPELTPESIDALQMENNRVQEFLIHSTDDFDKITQNRMNQVAVYTSQKIDSEACCGNISPFYFNSNTSAFAEAQKFNNCLNRKIGVDKKGQIKNCPSMPTSYGHIDDTKLADVLANEQFKKLWSISKDKVTTCQDCEFRYICNDCRAYLSEPNNELSKPAKCTYDPYQAKWEQQAVATS